MTQKEYFLPLRFLLQMLVSSAMHSPRLCGKRIHDAGRSAQLRSDVLGAVKGPVFVRLSLALVRELAAMPAG
jgi:hypothetical protein